MAKNARKGGESQEKYVDRVYKIMHSGISSRAREEIPSEVLQQQRAEGADWRSHMRAALRVEFNSSGGATDLRPHSITEHRVSAQGFREYKVRYYAKGYVMPDPEWKPSDWCLQYAGLVQNYMAVSVPPCTVLQ